MKFNVVHMQNEIMSYEQPRFKLWSSKDLGVTKQTKMRWINIVLRRGNTLWHN